MVDVFLRLTSYMNRREIIYSEYQSELFLIIMLSDIAMALSASSKLIPDIQ
jgi:hypothetical protein